MGQVDKPSSCFARIFLGFCPMFHFANFNQTYDTWTRVKQPVHWYLGDKVASSNKEPMYMSVRPPPIFVGNGDSNQPIL